jgi:hypothetical protein
VRPVLFAGAVLATGVYVPKVLKNKTWPDSVKKDFTGQIHKFMAFLTEHTHQAKGNTVLYIPAEEIGDIADAAQEKHLVRHSYQHQGTFTEPSRNLQGTFTEPSGNIQGTFTEPSGNIQGTFREHSGNIQGTFRERSGTFREHLGHSGNIWSVILFKNLPHCLPFITMIEITLPLHHLVYHDDCNNPTPTPPYLS